MSNKIKKFEDVMFSLRCKARRHAGNFSLIEYAENFGVETLLNYAWNARDELAKEREVELVNALTLAKEKLSTTFGCAYAWDEHYPEDEHERNCDVCPTIKRIEALLNGEGDE